MKRQCFRWPLVYVTSYSTWRDVIEFANSVANAVQTAKITNKFYVKIFVNSRQQHRHSMAFIYFDRSFNNYLEIIAPLVKNIQRPKEVSGVEPWFYSISLNSMQLNIIYITNIWLFFSFFFFWRGRKGLNIFSFKTKRSFFRFRESNCCILELNDS